MVRSSEIFPPELETNLAKIATSETAINRIAVIEGAVEKETIQSDSIRKAESNMNPITPTLGGKQFWTDYFIFREWRIQKNYLTKHFRLLDDRDKRKASGTFKECKAKFIEISTEEKFDPLSKKAVLLLHGLGRTRNSMNKLAKCFAANGYTPINFGYASTRAPIKAHAEALAKVISSLDGVEEIYVVGHSMGNIVFRAYLSHFIDDATQKNGDPRIQASVMIAPPNNGAYIARILKPTGVFGLVLGKSGNELASRWDEFAMNLATPTHRFAIVAGKFNYNPLFKVDNDFVVSVDETKLVGADDFQVYNAMHATIMANKEVVESVLRFFEKGFLKTEAEKNPLK